MWIKNGKHNHNSNYFLRKIFNKECFNDDVKENVSNFLLLQ